MMAILTLIALVLYVTSAIMLPPPEEHEDYKQVIIKLRAYLILNISGVLFVIIAILHRSLSLVIMAWILELFYSLPAIWVIKNIKKYKESKK